jgi:hypothetical protein
MPYCTGDKDTRTHATYKKAHTDEHTVAHECAQFATWVDSEPLAQDELEPISFRHAVAVNASLEDQVGAEVMRDKVG